MYSRQEGVATPSSHPSTLYSATLDNDPMLVSFIHFVLAMMVSIIISTQSGGTALFSAGRKGHPEVVKLLLGAGARDIPNKVDHRVTMMCRKSVLMNHRV